jgi:hypothetical protein
MSLIEVFVIEIEVHEIFSCDIDADGLVSRCRLRESGLSTAKYVAASQIDKAFRWKSEFWFGQADASVHVEDRGPGCVWYLRQLTDG